MLFCLLLLCGVALAQDICSDLTENEVPVTGGRPVLKEAQKILYVNILPGYDADMRTGYNLLVQTLAKYYPTSSADFWSQLPSNAAVGSLDKYTQIWVADLSYTEDNSATQMATYAAIAKWYKGKGEPHIICDGRWISELWHADAFRPSQKLVENYFVALATRGGGLLLATDHAEDYTRGINEINKGIGIGPFYGFYATPPLLLEVDQNNPIMKYPNDPTHHNTATVKYIYDDSSTSFTPYNIQPNGKILYPVGWHGAKGSNNPGISSTIRGALGFLIDITSPKCASRITAGTEVQFTAAVTKGGTAPIKWAWSSSLVGPIGGSEASFKWTPSIGQHIIKVTATDSEKLVAEDAITFRVVYDSTAENEGLGPNGDGTCYVFMRPGDEVTEIFPIKRTDTPLAYYSYTRGDAKPADIPLNLGDKSANFYLYTDNKTLSLNAIMSPLSLSGTISLDLAGRQIPSKATTLLLKDDALDSITWDSNTAVGSAAWNWKSTTKGFIIDGLPNQKSVENIWCVDIGIKNLQNIEYLSEFSHQLPSAKIPNPSPVIDSHWYILSVPTVSYCRTTCYAPPVVNLNGLVGSFAPSRIDWNAKTGGINYNDNQPTTWNIKPAGQNISGIGIHFVGPFGVVSSDSVKVFNGLDTSSVPLWSATTGASAAPAPIKTSAPNAVVSWVPNNDKKTDKGWTVWYAVIPTPLSLAPISGPESSHTWVTINGTNFVNTGKNVVRFGTVNITGSAIQFISNTSIRVNVPPSGKPLTVDVDVSNDGVFFQRVPQKYTFFAGTCKDVTVCGDCFNLAGCTWCTDTSNNAKSFCFAANSTTVTCAKDATHHTQNDCSDAPDIEVTVREGETIKITLVKQSLIGKVTGIKISGAYNGTFLNFTKSTGAITTNAAGAVTYTAFLYLNGNIATDVWNYELTGPGIKDVGKVTVTVTPFTREYLLTLWAKQRADECKNGTHNCQHLCLDGTPLNGYICGCRPGYNLTRNRFCEDIDECSLPNHGCLHGCTNLPGTYSCDCIIGYTKNVTSGKCEQLACPVSEWVEAARDPTFVATSMTLDLAHFVVAMNNNKPGLDWTTVPGYDCDSCDLTTTKTRAINHTIWNGSPKCGADQLALYSENHCGYPCKNTDIYNGLQAVDYAVDELTDQEWLDAAIRAGLAGNTSLFTEKPEITGHPEAWALNYFRVIFAECTDASIAQASDIIYSVLADILPYFAEKGRITVTRENVLKYPCAVRITIDDLVPSLSDCSNLNNNTFTEDYGDGLSSGEIAAITIGGVIVTAVAGIGAAAVLSPASGDAASYVAL